MFLLHLLQYLQHLDLTNTAISVLLVRGNLLIASPAVYINSFLF